MKWSKFSYLIPQWIWHHWVYIAEFWESNRDHEVELEVHQNDVEMSAVLPSQIADYERNFHKCFYRHLVLSSGKKTFFEFKKNVKFLLLTFWIFDTPCFLIFLQQTRQVKHKVSDKNATIPQMIKNHILSAHFGMSHSSTVFCLST